MTWMSEINSIIGRAEQQVDALEAEVIELKASLVLLMAMKYRKGLVDTPLFSVLITRFPEEWQALQASDARLDGLSSPVA